MKRSDLRVGMHVLYGRYSNWSDHTAYCARVVVEAVEPYIVNTFRKSGEPFYRKAPSGMGGGTLVRRVAQDGTSLGLLEAASLELLQLSQLKGEWGPTFAAVQQAEAERLAFARQEAEQRRDREARAAVVVERLRGYGVTHAFRDGETRLSISVDDFATLLDQLDASHGDEMLDGNGS